MEITVSNAYELPDLAVRWLELEARADGGFFLSWRWIGSWLRATGARPLLVQAQEAGKIVALGLLSPARRRGLLFSIDRLCLNETGRPEWDAVMIEHNGFLLAREAPEGAAAAIFRALQASDPAWDEIVLGGVSADMPAAARASGLAIVMDRVSPDFGVLLAGPDQAGRWEDSLSQNLRSQLRQSRNFAERTGPLVLQAAASVPQALEFFEKMTALHTAYWQSRGKPGAFATPSSLGFHREVIGSQAGLGQVDLLELRAGSQVLGYLYNFQFGARVYSYQSGFAYGEDNRHRPGLLAHALAIGQAQARGLRVYDFLAGEAPYKARLGQRLGDIVWCRGQRNRPLLRLERAAHACMAGLRR